MDNHENEIKTIEINSDNNEENRIIDEVVETKKQNLVTRLKEKKGVWGVLGIILAFLIKFKAILVLILTKFKFILVLLKFSKFASTLLSMLLMIYVYAKIYGWSFGIGFVLLLFIHEMGHYLTAKAVKLEVTTPLFIPFVGALISMKEIPKDAETEAKVAIGGPILGSLGALICLLLYFVFKESFFMALAYAGFILNLFNLIPLHPLDGGRTVTAISPKLWLIGIPLGVIAFLKFFNPIILIMLALGVMQAISQYKSPNKLYYEVEPLTRLKFALLYFGLILLLGIGVTYVHSSFSSVLIN